MRAELLPPLPPGRAPCGGGGYVHEPSWISVCHSRQECVMSGTAYCSQNTFDSREAMSGASWGAGQDEHMPQSPELRQDVII